MAPRKSAKTPHIPAANTTFDRIKPLKKINKTSNRSSVTLQKHQGFKLTRSCLEDNSFDDGFIEELSKTLPATSLSTWGTTKKHPVLAPSRKHRPLSVQRRLGNTWPRSTEQVESSSTDAVSCIAKKSLFMQAPLEVRERVFGHLLQSESPILLDYKLATVLQRCSNSNAILFVCRQLFSEASFFLYRTNNFVVVIRSAEISPFGAHWQHEGNILAPRFLPFLRTLMIECSKNHWGLCYLKQATTSVNTLIQAGAFLTSFTLIVSPRRVGMSTTALGLEARPISFADFLWIQGPFIQALHKLPCVIFRIVIKKSSERRLEMTVALRGLQFNLVREEGSTLINDETIKLSQARQWRIHEELAGLKERFEQVFEDDRKAIRLGLCTEGTCSGGFVA